MTVLSNAQIAQLMINAGFPPSAVPTGIGIAHAESGANPSAVNNYNTNGTKDYGLFQINSVHSSLLQKYNWQNAQQNADMAYQVYHAAGNSWTPWSTYNSGSYRKFVDNTVAIPQTKTPVSTSGNANASNAAFALPLPPINSLPIIGGSINAYTKFQEWMKNIWHRLFWFLMGLVMLIVGLIIVFRRPIAQGAGEAGKAAVVAAMA